MGETCLQPTQVLPCLCLLTEFTVCSGFAQNFSFALKLYGLSSHFLFKWKSSCLCKL